MNKKFLSYSLISAIFLHFFLVSLLNLQFDVDYVPEQEQLDRIYLTFNNSKDQITKIDSGSKKNIQEKHTKKPISKKNQYINQNLVRENTENFNANKSEQPELLESNREEKIQGKKNTTQKTDSLAPRDYLPNPGKLSILVYFGDYQLTSTPIGKGFLEVRYPSKENYELFLKAEIIGWASIFVSKPLFYFSKGKINSEGLTPEFYRENTPRRGESYVEVNQSKTNLYFSSLNETKTFDGENLQDPLSLVFQLSWLSQKNLYIDYGKLSSFFVFNRKKIKEISLTSDLPEEIVLPGGLVVEAIKIKSTTIESRRPGVISFWLDPSDNYLPVRISYKDEKTNKSVDFLVIREEFSSLSIKEKNNIKFQKDSKYKRNTHPYLSNY